MAVNAPEQIEKFQEFIEINYKVLLHDLIREGKKALIIDFSELAKFDHELAEQLLHDPEDTIKAGEISLDGFDISEDIHLRVRFTNLPISQKIRIKDIRSEHLNNFIVIEGIVRQASDVRPQVVNAKFECPSCGGSISILQIDSKFKEPSRCSCGRRGRFRLLKKDLVDAQRLIIEESPESLVGGEQPKRMSIFLKEDLVEPKLEKKTTPGSKIRVIGVVKEISIPLRTGGTSTRFDLITEANFIEPVEETFEEIEIGKKEVEKIKKLAKDPKIYDKLVNSIAPSIYGHEVIKAAMVLQLMGGVKKERKDGTVTRGDMHVLLVGDPGAAKSTILMYMSKAAPKARYVSGKGVSGAGLCVAPDSLVLTNPGGIYEIKDIVEENLTNNERFYCSGVWNSNNPHSDKKIFTLDSNLKVNPKEISQLWRITPPDYMIKLRTRLGKEVIVTPNTKLYTSGLSWKDALEFDVGDYLATARSLNFKDSEEKILTASLLKSNPVVIGVKDKVRFLIEKACKKNGWNKRTLAKNLKLSELSIYYNWVNEKARGNIKLKTLRLLAESVSIGLDAIIDEKTKFSLYNGHPISLPKYVNGDLLYFAGLIAGDGDLSLGDNTVVIRFSNGSNDLIQRFKLLSNRLFNVEPYISSEKSDKRPESWRFGSKLVFEVLESLGLTISPKSHRIDMSNTLLRMPNNLIASYLSGYYDTDGGCVERKTKGGNSIECSSTSKLFAEKLKLVLLRYGIIAKIRERKAIPNIKINSKYNKFAIVITGKRNLELFQKYIDFNCNEKKQKLDRIINLVSKPDTNLDIIPIARELIHEIEKDLKIQMLNCSRDKNGISKNYLLKILSEIKNHSHKNVEILDRLSNSDVFWDVIVEKQVIKNHYDYVYDLTVEDSHNFIVNGILVHNTASVVRDEFLKGWALEAGALVLANGGFLMIDELDKMSPDDRSAMHEALAQQRISISKANIQATLIAETTVLAAANPKLGRFDPYTSIASQIDLPPTLINRFDLIFPVRDIPNRELDEKIAGHVLELQQNIIGKEPEIPIPLLKKYVAYVKQNIFPRLGEDAVEEIKKFYVNLRNINTSGDDVIRAIPISARQLEALVRLAEGSARVRLSNVVTRRDAKRAISMLKHCLVQVGIDPETGQIDIDRISTGITATTRSRIVVIREIINDLAAKGRKTIPLEEIISEAAEKGIDEARVEEIIDKLKKEGEVFEPKRGFISKI